MFVSSTLDELRNERAAARAAIERLRLAAVMFEFGARPHPPRALYRAYLDQSHIFIGIYWENYGWVAPGMFVSGIEDEYELAAGKPCLVYVKEPAPKREQRLEALLERVRDEGRVSYKRFETAEQLDDLVADDLALLLAEQFEAGHHVSGGEPGSLRMRPLPVPPTALVGREEEIKRVCALIEREDVRLLTLSGIGGIGKTRLALATAAQIAARFADGVGFVDLSAVRSAELVPGAIAVAIGVSPEGTRPLIDSLHERLEGAQVLLVLDNFEHVVAAASFVLELLVSCPRLKVIVTSRALLRVRGEHEFQVRPLQTPTQAVRPEEAISVPAIRLFVERAQDRMPEFAVDRRNAEAVGELCRRLEGIPLALELAAAHVRVLPPAALLGRIGERLDVMTGPTDLPERQHTLKAAIDWSYELLDRQQRDVFARLSVFPAGFTLDSAEAVCGGGNDGDVIEVISSLIENSLVATVEVPDVEPRFRMLEIVREYAHQRLNESGDEATACRRMAQYFAQFVKGAAAGLVTSENRVWLQRMDQEVENVRAAAAWGIEHGEFDLVEEILVPPWIYWWTRGYLAELRPVAEYALSIDPPLRLANRARLLFATAGCRVMTGDSESAIPLLEELLQIQKARGDEHELALAQTVYCVANPIEAAAKARGLLEQAAATLRGLGDRWGAAFALATLGQIALRDGDVSQSERIQHEALEHAQAVESEHMVGIALNQLGFVALAQQDLDLARSRFAQSAQLHQHVRDREGLAYSLDGLAAVALAENRPEQAAKAIGTADAIRQTIGVTPWPIMRSLRDPLVADIKTSLSDDAFSAAHTAGSDTRPDDAIEELLSPRAAA